MRYENYRKNPTKAEIYALRTLNALDAKKRALECELATITYDSVSRSVNSLSGFFKAYSILLVLLMVAIVASFV